MSSPNPVLPFVPELPVAFQQFRLESPSLQGPVLNVLISPLLPTQHLHSQCGGRGVRKGRSRKGGLGNKNSKPTTKNRIKKEERKKKTTTKKQEALGADSTRKEKKKNKKREKKRSVFGKKEKKKKVLCIFFFQNFVVKLQDIGPCFQKFPNSLICFKCFRFLHLTGFWKL